MIRSNERVREELFQPKPQQTAINLLATLKQKLVVEAHIALVDQTMKDVRKL